MKWRLFLLKSNTYKIKLAEYNDNPNRCLYCGKPIQCLDGQTLAKVKEKKFCNSSCAASYNNKGVVRNKKGCVTNLVNPPKKKSLLENFSDEEIVAFYHTSETLKEFSQKLGYKDSIDRRSQCVHDKFKQLGLDLSKFKNVLKKNINPSSRNVTYKRKCEKCGKPIGYDNKSGYCQDCYIEINNQNRIEKWLATGDTGCAVGSNLRNCIRDYIYKSQDYKCAICGLPTIWNNKELKFVLDHIDGDSSNNKKENLRLICPNCDSQLDTYKSKNKNSARNHRHKYYEEYNKAL